MGARRSPDGDTCAFCVVDGDGLAISAIQSIYHDLGSGLIAGDTGVLMQNRGSFFSLDEDHPNRLEPGKRTFHTLIPSMALRDGDPYLVYGTMGGEGQPQTQAAIVTRLEDFGYDVQQAIEAPRWLMGRTWGVESRDLSLEGRISDEVARELECSRTGTTTWATRRRSGSVGTPACSRAVRTRAATAPPWGASCRLGLGWVYLWLVELLGQVHRNPPCLLVSLGGLPAGFRVQHGDVCDEAPKAQPRSAGHRPSASDT